MSLESDAAILFPASELIANFECDILHSLPSAELVIVFCPKPSRREENRGGWRTDDFRRTAASAVKKAATSRQKKLIRMLGNQSEANETWTKQSSSYKVIQGVRISPRELGVKYASCIWDIHSGLYTHLGA